MITPAAAAPRYDAADDTPIADIAIELILLFSYLLTDYRCRHAVIFAYATLFFC